MLIERLSAFLDGDLSTTECGRISRHAASCPRCTRLTAELRSTVGLCQRAASTPLPPALRRKARASIQRLLKEDAKTH
jgi:anti-sigma factor RsiW